MNPEHFQRQATLYLYGPHRAPLTDVSVEALMGVHRGQVLLGHRDLAHKSAWLKLHKEKRT